MHNKPDIASTLRAEGIDLTQRGQSFWAVCSFHAEKTPSSKVDPERQTFYCFGCGAHGDVIDFIQRFKGLTFKDTLTYLGMTTGKPNRQAQQRIEREKRKRAAVAAFRAWCANEYNELADNYRKLQQAKDR